jgi:hypothetical protein
VYVADGNEVIVTAILKEKTVCCIEANTCRYNCSKECGSRVSLKEHIKEKIKFIRRK